MVSCCELEAAAQSVQRAACFLAWGCLQCPIGCLKFVEHLPETVEKQQRLVAKQRDQDQGQDMPSQPASQPGAETVPFPNWTVVSGS